MSDTRPKVSPLSWLVMAAFAVATLLLFVGKHRGWLESSWLEIAGSISGAACVLLVVHQNIWNFPIGIISCALYLAFFYEGKLYGDAGLQVGFILLNVHGWYHWYRGTAQARAKVQRVPLGELCVLAAIFPLLWLGLMYLLKYVGGAVPPMDAFITSASILAQYLLNRRYIESWLAWIVVDQVSIVVYIERGMYLTAVLYAIFLLMCIAGMIEWARQMQREKS